MSYAIFNDGVNFYLPCTASELPNKARDVWAHPDEFGQGLSKIKKNLNVAKGAVAVSLKVYINTLPKLVELPKRFREKYPDLRWSVRALRYARNDFNDPVGVVVIDLAGFVGVSMLNTHKGDQWDPVAGIRKALYRTAQKKTIRDRLEEFKELAHTDRGSFAFRENASAVLRALSAVSNDQIDNIVNGKSKRPGLVDMDPTDKPVPDNVNLSDTYYPPLPAREDTE